MNSVHALVTEPRPETVEPPPVVARPSFPEIFRTYGPFVWRTLRAHGVPERHLDDACQEVFLTVFRRLDSFEGRSTLRTWIYGICIRVSMNCLRRAHVRREVPTETLPDSGSGACQEHEFERKELAERLVAVLALLPPDRREVFRLYEIEGLTMPEVARIMACPLSTAYSRLHAARRHVESLMLDQRSPNVAHGTRDAEARRRTQVALSLLLVQIPPREALERLAQRLTHPATLTGAGGGALGSALFSSWKTAAAVAALGLATTSALQFAPAVRHARAEAAMLVATPGSEPTSQEALVHRRTLDLARPALETAAPRDSGAAEAPGRTTAAATAAPKTARTRRPSARRGRPTDEAGTHAATLAPGGTLGAELELLRRAQRALDARPIRALSLLLEHERAFGASAFEQEREAMAVEALVRAGKRDAARARSDRFMARFPASAYNRRLSMLLAGRAGE